MPITKSAKKALRQSRRRQIRNIERKGAIRTAIKEALQAKDQKQITLAYKAIDKAAQRGVIKKNTAARKKSRLVKALQRSAK